MFVVRLTKSEQMSRGKSAAHHQRRISCDAVERLLEAECMDIL